MGILARGIKLPNIAPVQGPHDADARKHRRATMRCQHQGFHCRKPFWRFLFGLWDLGYVIAGVPVGDEAATAPRTGFFVVLVSNRQCPKQATAYRKLAAERAKKPGLEPGSGSVR
jgi:hypothetical protein